LTLFLERNAGKEFKSVLGSEWESNCDPEAEHDGVPVYHKLLMP
jgi:hypothetical protein